MSTIAALLHLTIPRESNNFKARILHSPMLLLIAGFLALTQFAIFHVPTIAPPEPVVLGYASQISLDDVVKFTNQKRAAEGLGALTVNQTLSTAALAKGKDMLAKGYWAHVAPDGTEPWDFFKTVGYKYRYAGENLARDFASASTAVDAWMASQSHRENMLSSKYKEIGVAVVEGNLNGKDATIIVQLFGTQAGDQAIPVASAKTNNPAPSPAPVAAAKAPEVSPAPKIADAGLVLTGFTNNLAENRFDISKTISLVLLVGMSLLFIVDAFIVGRRSITRISGRSVAHLSFIGMIIIILAIVRSGQII